MSVFIHFMATLNTWESLALVLILLVFVLVVIEWIFLRIKIQKNAKMLRDYLILKNDHWTSLTRILTDDKDFDEDAVGLSLKMDLSLFDKRYRDLIFHELLILKSVQRVNLSNYTTLERMLKHSK